MLIQQRRQTGLLSQFRAGDVHAHRSVPEEYRRSRSSSRLRGWHAGGRLIAGQFGGQMTSTTALTRLLVPPALPARPRMTALLGLCTLIFLLVVGDLFSADPVTTPAVGLALAVTFGAFPVFWIVDAVRRIWQRRTERQLVERASSLWHQCWYCGRCGRAFLRGETSFLPPGRLAPTLRRRAAQTAEGARS
jgi:hypothetical protein